jgi:hypothetical protein
MRYKWIQKDGTLQKVLDEKSFDSLVAGEREPEDKHDWDLLDFLGGVRPRPWPSRWLTCKRCHVEWQAEGAPWPVTSDSLLREVVGLIENGWAWPFYCEPCGEWLKIFGLQPAGKPQEKSEEKPRKTPYKDE